MSEKICKCGNAKCNGFTVLHPIEVARDMKEIKERMKSQCGNVKFELKDSPSSGEIFTKFYELHVINS